MTKKIKFIKNCDGGFIDEIKNYSNGSADSLVEQGYAEYHKETINQKKQLVYEIQKTILGRSAQFKNFKLLPKEFITEFALKEIGYEQRHLDGFKEDGTIKETKNYNPKITIDSAYLYSWTHNGQQMPQKEEKQDTNEKDEILILLEEDESVPQGIEMGFNENMFWYGFKLKGKNSIIASNKKVYRNTFQKIKDECFGTNEIKEFIGNYRGYIGDIAPTISNTTVKRYILSQENNIKKTELYNKIKNKLLYFMDFGGQEEIADVMTCWIIATYCYELFPWFPNVLMNAPTGSGKSKCFYILLQLAFRGFDLGASGGVSAAQIFRTLEGNRGVIGLDEFEKSNNPKDEGQRLVNQIINAGASKDSYVIRCEQVDKKWYAKKFPIFCPKIVANITGINPTSLSRFVAFKWLRTASVKGKRKPQKPNEKAAFIELRNEIYLLILENWKEIKDIYEALDIPNLNNRNEDNWLPLFTIGKFMDGKGTQIQDQLNKYLVNYKELDIETDDISADFFRIILDCADDEIKKYSPKEISEWVDVAHLLQSYKSPDRVIGRWLTLYKFRKSRSGGVRKYEFSKKGVQEIINLYFNESTDETTQKDTNDT